MGVVELTDNGSRGGSARLYGAVVVASVPVACSSGRGGLSLAACCVLVAALSFAGCATSGVDDAFCANTELSEAGVIDAVSRNS